MTTSPPTNTAETTTDTPDPRSFNITARNREEEFHFNSDIMRNLAEGIFLVRFEDNRIAYANPRFEAMFGYDPGEMIGKDVAIVNAPTDKSPEETKAKILKVLHETGEWHGEVENIKKDGTHFWCYANVSLSDHYEYGRVIISVHTDITDQKIAETALRESEARYRLIVETATEGIWVLGPDTRTTFVNARMAEMLGYTCEEMIGRPGTDFMYEEDALNHLSRMESRRHGISESYERRLRRKDGGTVWTLASATTIFDDKHNFQGAFAMLTDITGRKQAETELSHLAAIVETSDDAIISKSLKGKILSWNRAAERLYGYQAKEVIGLSLSILIPMEKQGELSIFLDNVKAGKSLEHYETSRLRKDGSRVEVSLTVSPIFDDSGKVIGASSIAHDITARKQLEDNLRLANAYNRSLIEASLDPLVTIDIEGRITDVNTATEKVTGFPREELIGNVFSNFFSEPDNAEAGYQQVFMHGAVYDYALEIKHRDGHLTPVLYNATVYRDETGQVIGVFAAARDITERKQSEEKINTLNNELENRVKERTAESERLYRELEGFCYAISHEFRAPIARLEGFGSMLLELVGEDDKEPIIHCAKRIVAAGRRLRTVIDSLLTMNRLSRADILLSPVNLSEISKQIADELLEQIDNRTIEIRIAPDIFVQGDRYLLEICMKNLLGNAIKYTSRTVEASIEFGKQRSEGVDIYFVRDNGVGFDMESAKNLFVPFCRLHSESEFEGTGIGLATVQRIIEKHDGRIWAEAAPLVGATFYFTLGLSEGVNEKSVRDVDRG